MLAAIGMNEVRTFLTIAARHLASPLRSKSLFGGAKFSLPEARRSSSTFTTFDCLMCDAIYFRGELPLESDLSESYVADFAWATLGPIAYGDVAHVLIPRFFTQEIFESQGRGKPPRFLDEWEHEQDIDGLSQLLDRASISHSLTAGVLELKRF